MSHKKKERDEMLHKMSAIRIATARKSAGITQVKFAKMLNVARQTLIDLESGLRLPRLDCIVLMSQITNKPILYFFPSEECVESESEAKLQEVKGKLEEVLKII